MSERSTILGASSIRIMLQQIAPNILPPVAFVALLDVARMMIFEAIFGFIGIGIQPPTPTFGTIIADGTKYLLNAWWITTIPGLLLALCLCSINLMGGALERARNTLLQRPMMESTRSILEVSHLSVDLEGRERRRILDDISITLEADTVLGIIGQSGSGKTVLSRALSTGCGRRCASLAARSSSRVSTSRRWTRSAMQKLRGREIAYIGSDPANALDPTLPIGRQIAEKLISVETRHRA